MINANFHRFQIALGLAIVAALFAGIQPSYGQIVQQAVGGIAIDADGAVSAPTRQDHDKLAEIRATAVAAAPADLQAWTDLRAVSLRQLEAKIAAARQDGQPLPEAVRFLAGLQRVEYVLVYPERNDVVLAGPAEGWRVDALGNVVGTTSGRPVLLLDDLVVAMRTRDVTELEAISCSIDPTPEGMQRFRALMRRQRTIGDPESTMRRMAEALGPQKVSVTGVPVTSHFARTMVAADFRMKRLAMNFEDAPVDEMPSFLHLLKAARSNANMTPRWWLAADYEPLVQDADGLAWQLRGQGVKCKTEADQFNTTGERERSVQASPAAARWAETFTDRYSELADHDSAFAMLRNVMDLAVVAALIDRHRLLDRAQLELPEMLHEHQIDRYHAPTRVASQATFVKRRGDYLISTSGGVQLFPWEIVENATISDDTELSSAREAFAADADSWYRN